MVHIRQAQRQVLFVSAVFIIMGFLLVGLLNLAFATLASSNLSEIGRFFTLVLIVCVVGLIGSVLLYYEGVKRFYARFDKIQEHIVPIFLIYFANAAIMYFIVIRTLAASQKSHFFFIAAISLAAMIGIFVFELLDHTHARKNPKRRRAYALYALECCVWIAIIGIAYIVAVDAFILANGVLTLFAV